QRTLERQTMREFELRVLFQMSAADSSNLIDSPLASKLGAHRALFQSEEEGRLEEFRPYCWPADDRVEWGQRHFRGREAAEVGCRFKLLAARGYACGLAMARRLRACMNELTHSPRKVAHSAAVASWLAKAAVFLISSPAARVRSGRIRA